MVTYTKKQSSAWAKVGDAIRKKVFAREQCSCGSQRYPIAHHDDYDEPLKVEFVCRKCHRGIHSLEHFSFLSDDVTFLESDTERSLADEQLWQEYVSCINAGSRIRGRICTAKDDASKHHLRYIADDGII